MAVDDLLVERQVVRGRLVGDAAAGERALRVAVGEHLAADLADLPGLAGGEGYWVIRRLALQARVGSGWTSTQVSRALARSVTRGVGTALSDGPDATTVLWFPSHASYLARFLCDLAEHRAAGRWEYAGLVDPGASPAEALDGLAAERPGQVGEALLELTRAEAELVVEGLAPDQGRLLQLVAGQPAQPGRVGPVLRSLRRLLTEGRSVGALLLAVAAARDHECSLAQVADPARAAADAVAVVRAGGELAAASLRAGRWGDLARHGDGFLGVVGWSVEQRAELTAAVTEPAPRASGERAHTAFGGAFLLLRFLDDLWDWAEATRGWPAVGGFPPAGPGRLVCVAVALGEERCAAATRDPLLRRLLGVPEELDLGRWLASVPRHRARSFDEVAAHPGEAAAVALPSPFSGPAAGSLGRAARLALQSLGRRLPGMAGSSPTYLRRNVLDLDAWVELEDREVVVELGDPPLAVLVSMAGLNRGSFVLSDAEGVRWTLTTSR